MSIITRSVTKTFKSSITKSVDTSRVKIKKTEKETFEETFEENEKNLINNVVIQQLRRNDAKAVCEMKKFLKFSFNLLTTKIEKF